MTADGPKTRLYVAKSAHRPAYRGAVRGFSLVFVALGLVLLAVTLIEGGGPLSVGVLLGLAFVAVGAGRLWTTGRMGH